MVVVFVIFTVMVFVSIDFFIQKKKNIGFAGTTKPTLIPLSRIFRLIPGGIFLQPAFTWSKIQDNGELIVGLNPILLGLIGQPDEIVIRTKSGKIKKGDTLFEIRKDGKKINVKSPISGEISRLNSHILQSTNWENVNQNWIYTLKAENFAQEISQWLIAESAQVWLQEKYQQLKEFFRKNTPHTELGPVLADGGDIPMGILSQFDENTWKNFENEFMN